MVIYNLTELQDSNIIRFFTFSGSISAPYDLARLQTIIMIIHLFTIHFCHAYIFVYLPQQYARGKSAIYIENQLIQIPQFQEKPKSFLYSFQEE